MPRLNLLNVLKSLFQPNFQYLAWDVLSFDNHMTS